MSESTLRFQDYHTQIIKRHLVYKGLLKEVAVRSVSYDLHLVQVCNHNVVRQGFSYCVPGHSEYDHRLGGLQKVPGYQ